MQNSLPHYIIENYYNFQNKKLIKTKSLYGYENQNFLLVFEDDSKFLLKTFINDDQDKYQKQQISAQINALNYINTYLQKKNENNPQNENQYMKKNIQNIEIPQVIETKKSKVYLDTVESFENKKIHFMLLTFIDGKIQVDFLKETENQMELNQTQLSKLRVQIGVGLGIIDKVLENYEDFFLQGFLLKWDLKHFLRLENQAENDHNVIIYPQKNELKGFIDFGDIIYTQKINELAITIAYNFQKDILNLDTVVDFLKGYLQSNELEILEIQLLYYLIPARMIQSIILSQLEVIKNPENEEYLTINQQPFKKLLKQYIQVSPTYFFNYIMEKLNLKKPEDKINTIQELTEERLITEALTKQANLLNINTRYLHQSLTSYSKKLLSLFNPKLKKIFFVNSGSAATDLALRIIYQNKKQLQNQQTLNQNDNEDPLILVFDQGYHGNTLQGINISAYKYNGKGGQQKPQNIIELPLPDINGLKIEKNINFEDAQKILLNQTLDILKKFENSEKNKQIQAFIFEPVIGCGGQIDIPQDFLIKIVQQLKKNNPQVLIVVDEVQTGFGRLGCPKNQNFWGYQQYENLNPDIVILGKPMGNGHPIGGVVTTQELVEKFENGMEFFSSFGGNPVSCVVGEQVINILQNERLLENSYNLGKYFFKQLQDIQQEYQLQNYIGYITGKGLFIGLHMYVLFDDLGTKSRHAGLSCDRIVKIYFVRLKK
ncbi:Pyridoxal phosphate-dependent transferase [Pseudocohnilembus persalinus]|uniref:Pyridoxal phosphate-dependent transferase n=1 Tax=Pseudocohnilembus persalinus TaxID=266149 RepID=A0A0V0QZW8_PSEPJ|nr:Pyridoxal phosphate-dependent transferase [Pseudocohnilembus persalinus]|eukprot:KRX07594.1 Pyridoxal phosphate-dependent transferase [Pseudocohnilembus persalinus]